MVFEFENAFKLIFALFVGMAIGVDRQLKHKPIGLKTTTVISIASCLVTIISIEAFHLYASPVYNAMDPMRLTAQIVSGVGFLGAGVILRRNNDVISGLTSAALIWAASGLGIAVGIGFYFEAVLAVILFILAVNILPTFIKKVGPKTLRERDVSVTVKMNPNYRMTELFQAIEKKGSESFVQINSQVRIRNIKIVELDQYQQVELLLSAPEEQSTTEIYYFFKKIEHVLKVEVEHL